MNLSSVVNSPRLNAQAYTIQRSTGSFVLGGYQSVPTPVPGFGVISVASAKELQQTPEGDSALGAMVFRNSQPLYTTNTTGISDIIEWQGDNYRIQNVEPWVDYGYFKAIGVRMARV